MSDERTARLTANARARADQTLQRAQQALAAMATTTDPVTVAGLAHRAAVSRSWIYTQPELLERVEQLRAREPVHPNSSSANSRASVESLRRRLELAHQRIAGLHGENQQLRHELAQLHGQLREKGHS